MTIEHRTWHHFAHHERDQKYLERFEREGNLYIFVVRSASIFILLAWAITLSSDRSIYYIVVLLIFFLLGIAAYFVSRRRFGAIFTFALMTIDIVLLTIMIVLPPPIYIDGWTVQINQRLPNYIFLIIYLCVLVMSYSPARILWAGFCSVIAWASAFAWLASLPETKLISADSIFSSGDGKKAIADFLDPDAVNLTAWINQSVGLVIITMILTYAVWRSRLNINRQIAIEKKRANLSNYFSPEVAEFIAGENIAEREPLVQPVATIFVDMVGFTSLSENLPPSSLIAVLREFHRRLAQVVFANSGTVDKYIGDCVMVHFGAPYRQADDPVRAMKTISHMMDTIDDWNRARLEMGHEAINIGIGAHYGDVVVGNVGHESRLEFAVIGDTVNVASRLERATRELGVVAVVSDDLVQATLRHGPLASAKLSRFQRLGEISLDGREGAIAVWTAR